MNQLLSRLYWRRYLRRNANRIEDLEQFPGLDPGAQRRRLAALLLDQIRYFGARPDALPEWRDAARINDPLELFNLWPSLPIVSKEMLQTRFEPREMQQRLGLEGKIVSTGGSTGQPTHFLHELNMTRASNAADAYTRIKMGWHPGMPVLRIWGSDADIGHRPRLRVRVHQRLLNEIAIDGYNLTASTARRVLEAVRRHRQIAVYGFTSMLEFVARTLADSGTTAPVGHVRAAWNGGEMLFEEQSTLFQQVFGVPILNRYGGRELGCLACQFEPRAPLTILRPFVFLEIVDDQGRPARPGESGRILGTSTICRGTPFLRYEIGDMGTYSDAHRDESGISNLSRVDGRVSGLLTLPDGRRINSLFWNHCFKEFQEVHEFQVVLRTRSLGILLRGKGFTRDRSAALETTLRGFLHTVPFTVAWVERIPRTTLGKLVQVVRE